MRRLLLAALLVTSLWGCADAGWHVHRVDGIGYRYKLGSVDFERLQREALSAPTARADDIGAELRVAVPARKRIYLFTKESHAAHPAVIVMHVSAEPITRAEGFAGGEIAAFEAWLKEVARSRNQLFAAYGGGS